MARQSFKLEGVKEMTAALKALGAEVATKAGAKATRKATNVLRDGAKNKAPFNPGDTARTWKTKSGSVSEADYGHLRDNIKTRKRKARQLHTVSYVITTGNAFWGRFSEFGTAHEAAKPWFKPAVDQSAGEAVSVLMKELKKAIDQAARKAGKA